MSPVGVTLKINLLQQCKRFFRVLFSACLPSTYAVCVNQCINRIIPMNTTIEAVLYNSAIADGLIRKADYPFDAFKVSRFKEATAKRSLTKEDIRRIMNCKVRTLTKYPKPFLQLAKDLFLFCYLSCGINLTDMLHIRYTNSWTDGWWKRREMFRQVMLEMPRGRVGRRHQSRTEPRESLPKPRTDEREKMIRERPGLFPAFHIVPARLGRGFVIKTKTISLIANPLPVLFGRPNRTARP